ncbi:hypothetical protein PG997_015003 [Apiospora hydei]|uniref:Uncharacterized protein n=1 Tax=Apiospora hydei TaxID=1337664 RepID=A0ABR1UVE1_9PEZI
MLRRTSSGSSADWNTLISRDAQYDPYYRDPRYIIINSHGVPDKATADPHPSYGTNYGGRRRLDAQSNTGFPGGSYDKQLQIPAIKEDAALVPPDQKHWSALDWVHLIPTDPENHGGREPQSGSRSEADTATYLPSNKEWLDQSTIEGSEIPPETRGQFKTKGGTARSSGTQTQPDGSLPAFKDIMSRRSDLGRSTLVDEKSRHLASSTESRESYERPVIIQRPYVLTQVASSKRNRDCTAVYHQQREDRKLKKQRISFKPKGTGSRNPRTIQGDEGNEIPTSRVGERMDQMHDEDRIHRQNIRDVDRPDEKTSQFFVEHYRETGASPPQPVKEDLLSSSNPEPHVLVHSETQSTPNEPTHFIFKMWANWCDFSSYTIWKMLFEWYHSGLKLLWPRIRETYNIMRGPLMRNPFRVAKKVEYVKFDLIHRHKSGECVGNYQTDSIPTLKEVIQREYAFSPCPPLIGPMPIQSHLFMHSFLNPGDHSGNMAVKQLPKKVGRKLRCTGLTDQRSDPGAMPFGWGIYIVEGLNTTLVVWLLGAGILAIFLLAVVWTAANNDVQGGMGIGQFALAFLALLLTTAAVKESNTLPAFG